MSLADQMLAAGFETHVVSIHGNAFRIESCRLNPALAGLSFQAVDLVDPIIPLDTELGSDPRECTHLYIPQSYAALISQLESQDQLSGRGATWTIVRWEDNPSENSIDVWLKKNQPGKD